MNLLDRAVCFVSPVRGARRARARTAIEQETAKSALVDAQKEMVRSLMGEEVTNTGYSHGAASRRRSWAKEFHSSSKSAKSDIEKNRKLKIGRAHV